MDFVVRYLAQGTVKTRYLTSAFLGHTRAEDLKAKFEEAVSDLNVKKLAQVSMDGAHVDWKLLDMLEQDRSSQDQYQDFLNMGSCSPHVVHGAFHSGMLKTSWGIDSVLKALREHQLLRELWKSGLTLQPSSGKPQRNPRAKFQHPTLSRQ